jgi:uncharacterized protein (DUF2147 family)
MITKLLFASGLLIAVPAFAHGGAHLEGTDVYGTWLVGSGSAHVEISDCGDGTPCGTLVHINAPNAASLLDDKNPDAELAKKPLIGSRMLWGFEAKKSKWSGGRIYDAESGKDYKSKIQRQEDGTLEVKGCVGPFCQSQTWTKVEPK